jgi:hypothetical protein
LKLALSLVNIFGDPVREMFGTWLSGNASLLPLPDIRAERAFGGTRLDSRVKLAMVTDRWEDIWVDEDGSATSSCGAERLPVSPSTVSFETG